MNDSPQGFVPMKLGSTIAAHSGALHARCRRGMLCLFADIVLSSAAQYQTDIPRQFLATISLQLDFVKSAPLGDWVQGEADILDATKKLVLSQGLITSDGKTVARASGVFRRGPLLPDTESDHLLRLPGMPGMP